MTPSQVWTCRCAEQDAYRCPFVRAVLAAESGDSFVAVAWSMRQRYWWWCSVPPTAPAERGLVITKDVGAVVCDAWDGEIGGELADPTDPLI